MAETNETTVIAGDTHIKGEMTFERAARIVGQFDGKITAKGQLQVAEAAVCRAEVTAGDVVVDGAVEGNLTANAKVQVNAKARVRGDIVAERLVTAEGASIFGHVAVGQDAKEARAGKGLAPGTAGAPGTHGAGGGAAAAGPAAPAPGGQRPGEGRGEQGKK